MANRIVRRSLLAAALTASTFSYALDTVTPQGVTKRFESVVNNGSWNLVMLWSHDCIPCERQKPLIAKFNDDYSNRGVVAKGLSTDSVNDRAKSMKVLNRSTPKYDNYLYDGTNFSHDYRALVGEEFIATPTYHVYDKGGNLVGVHVGTVTRTMLDRLFKDKTSKKVSAPTVDLVR